MPIRADLSRLEGFIRTTVLDPLLLKHIREHLHNLRQTRAFRHAELVDARDVSKVPFTTRDLMSIARHARNTLGSQPNGPRAVVVEGDKAFGGVRFVAGLMAGWARVGVFQDANDAERWLEERKEWELPPSADWHPDE